MSGTEGFDEIHGVDAAGFWLYLAGAEVFDLADSAERQLAGETAAFMAIATDHRPRTAPITDELIEAAGETVQKIVPPNI